jgi:hypothetical protein
VRERFPGEGTERFLKLFDEYVKVPSEEERLRMWGHSVEKSGSATDASSASVDHRSESSEGVALEDAHTPTSGGLWGLKLPSDITWADGTGPGEFPLSDFRNSRLKLIPTVTEGPWVVRSAVRPKPVILGRKVVVRHFKGPGYMESDVHVGSSYTASRVVGVCRGASKYFAADVGIVIQGESMLELPERLVGCVSINKIDTEILQALD